MAALDDLFRAAGDDAVELAVHAQAGAGRTEVVGRHGDALKIRVAAPPERGKANDAIAQVLASAFGVAASAVTLASGGTSKAKRFRIEGVEPGTFSRRLAAVLDEAAGLGGRRGGRR